MVIGARRPRSGSRTPDTEGPRGACQSDPRIAKVHCPSARRPAATLCVRKPSSGATCRKCKRGAGVWCAEEIPPEREASSAEQAAAIGTATPMSGPPPACRVIRLAWPDDALTTVRRITLHVGGGAGRGWAATRAGHPPASSPPPTRPAGSRPASADRRLCQ